MKYEHWQIPAAPEDAIKTLMDAGYPYLVSSVLAARGVQTSEQAAEALEREKTLAYSPFLMKDMDKAVARISKALENGEKLAVFGDYDVDGITSTCLLTDYLRSRGADVTMHIPRRIEEGYGLGCGAIRALSESGVTLIVTVDCGITGVDETAYAATLGVDLVITDHHECKEQLPAAVAVVDPHRPDCPYPSKHLAGVGVALKLVLALGEGREDALFARYCTLAAIGTIADVMRMEGENRTIVQCGLESIDRSDFTGLHALLREAGLTSRPISSIQIGFVLAPRINAAGRMGRAELAAELVAHRRSRPRGKARARAVRAQPRAPERGAGHFPPRHRADGGPSRERAQCARVVQRGLAPRRRGHCGVETFRKILLPELYDPPLRRVG